jgi:hypothetical protein
MKRERALIKRLCSRVSVVALGFLLPTVAHAQHGAEQRAPRAWTTSPIPAADLPGWRADLGFLLTEMERIHPDLYHSIERDRLRTELNALDRRMPGMAAHEIVVDLARIVALVGDGHTSLPLYFAGGVDFHVLPIRFGIHRDTLYVEAADRSIAGMVGARVVAIGNTPADSAVARVASLISKDNKQWISAVAPHLLNRAEVLHALRLSDRIDGARLTVERNGRRTTHTVAALSDVPPPWHGLPFLPRYSDDWVDARDDAGMPAPLHQRTFPEMYAFELVPDRRLLYIGFHQVMNRPGDESALAFFQRAMAYAREHAASIDRIVLDLRHNTGGDGSLLDPIVREIVRTREVDQPGRFFVLIGPRTFSAAIALATQLERYTSAIFAGEPTGGSPNGFGSHEVVHLPNIGVDVMVSPHRFQNSAPFDTRPWIAPRLAAAPSFADFAANRDPLLELVASWDAGRSVAQEIERDLGRGDTIAALARIRGHDADPVNRFFSSTSELNRLGYRLLREGRTRHAITCFELNVRAHPDYANGWDSLGEALAAAGERDRAIAAYERAVALDPHNSNAREWLRRLRVVGRSPALR